MESVLVVVVGLMKILPAVAAQENPHRGTFVPGGTLALGIISPCTCKCMAFHTIHNNNGLVIVVKLEKSVASGETQAPVSPNAL